MKQTKLNIILAVCVFITAIAMALEPQLDLQKSIIRSPDKFSQTVDNCDGTFTVRLTTTNFRRAPGNRDAANLVISDGFTFCELCPASGYGFIPSQGWAETYDFGFGEEAIGDCRFMAEFDISGIPDDADVTDVYSEITYTSFDLEAANDLFFDYRSVTTNLSDDCAVVVADILAGNIYGSVSAPYTANPGTNFVSTDLSSQAETDIEAALMGGDDFWYFGTDWTGVTGVGNDVLHVFDAAYSGQDPVLVVTYASAANPPVITNVTVTGYIVETTGTDVLDVTVTWTDLDSHVAGDFTASLFCRSEVGADETYYSIYDLGTGAVSGSDPNWQATFSVDPAGSFEIGLYDLKVQIYDGTALATSGFDDNQDVFQATTSSNVFYYDDWNDSHSNPPNGWTVAGTTYGAWSSLWNWASCPDDYICLAGADLSNSVDTVMTQSFDCTSWTDVHLNLWSGWEGTGSSTGVLDYSIDGGTNWESPLLNFSGSGGLVADDYDFQLSGSSGQSEVVVRFHFTAAAGEGLWYFNTLNLYGTAMDPPPVITDLFVSPSSVENLGPDVFDMTMLWTDGGSQVAGDFTAEAYIRSDVDVDHSIGYPNTVTETSPGTWQAVWENVDLSDTLETGYYDLMGTVCDGISQDTHMWTENPDELEVISPVIVFFYEDWNDNPSATGWTSDVAQGNDWTLVSFTAFPDDYMVLSDSGKWLPDADTTTSWVSDPISCNLHSIVYLNFNSEFHVYNTATATVDYSINGGSTWEPAVLTIVVSEEEDYDIELPNAPGTSNLVVRFTFDGLAGDINDGNYWLLNTIQLRGNPPPPIPATGHAGVGLLVLLFSCLIIWRIK